MMMKTVIRKWGNSLAVRIPKAISEQLDVSCDSHVELSIEKGCLVLRPARRTFDLASLLADITNENLHEEISTGKPVGREEW
jgi:antitoxin MazE